MAMRTVKKLNPKTTAVLARAGAVGFHSSTRVEECSSRDARRGSGSARGRRPERPGRAVAARSGSANAIEAPRQQVCDIQERFRDVIMGFESLVKCSSFVVRAAGELSMPVVVTEQRAGRAGRGS